MSPMNRNAGLYDQNLSYPEYSAPYQCLAQPWFVRVPHPVYYPRYRCSIEPLICGEKVFRRIANDVKRAKHSVDIITWGFDPGMVLIRGANGEAGQRYGELLREIATRTDNPVTVRIIVWHDDVLAHGQAHNNPGFYGTRYPSIGTAERAYFSESHQDFNAEWYAQASADKIPNIHFRVRDVPIRCLGQSLLDETPPRGWKVEVAKRYATHHQKMLLVDYEDPVKAVGYVMGHNSITDFWDTEEHLFRDPRRERFYDEEHAAVQKAAWKEGQYFTGPGLGGYKLTEHQQVDKERLVQSYIDKHSHITKPYQDVSCRLLGPILYDLNHNFCDAWEQSKRPSSLFAESCWLAVKALTFASPVLKHISLGLKSATDNSNRSGELDFIKIRQKISVSDHQLPGGQHSVQLLRTQPLHGEKAIKECYANLTRQTQHYIFIQNQYIQYQDWAEHLIECVGRLRSAGYLKSIYVFILTSTPESDGMDEPTYGVASKLGRSENMKMEHDAAVERARRGKGEHPITPAKLQKQGINVFMGSLWTCAQRKEKLRPEDFEEIYIHAKVAIVDDDAFTIGSANLNLRSMALDSELNVLSEAKDVAFQLRSDLFGQCTGNVGPVHFGDMQDTFQYWKKLTKRNDQHKKSGERLESQLLSFHVDRKPGSPVI